MKPLLFGAALALLLSVRGSAEVTLPALLTDHMVLQRRQPIHLWGKADPAESVSVTFGSATITTAADGIGHWSLYLPPREAGGPFDLTIKGTNTIHLQDILVGDVWVASGQSNMEFELRNADNGSKEVSGASHPNIRLFLVKRNVASHPLDNVEAKPWAPCSPESAADFSAVAYFFGREIHKQTQVPVGLIETNWGGTPAESWTSLHALSSDASLMPVFAEWAHMTDTLVTDKPKRDQQLAAYRAAAAEAKTQGKPAPAFPWMANDGGEWEPASLYNAMIAPLTPFPIRGVIWYQGESNASEERAPLYRRLFGTMIENWRHDWNSGEFPFLFVQIANYKTGPHSWWPQLREAQLETLELANTGMAVTIDIGNPANIHPTDKQDVGHRLALAARAISYGEKIEDSGPLYRNAVPEGGAMRVWFDHAASGLVAKDGGQLTGFEIAGPDRIFVSASGRIEGTSVVLTSPGVEHPAFARYGWADNPACNLYNSDKLPASPFETR